MSLEKIISGIRKVANHKNKVKPLFDSVLDPAFFVVSTNLAYIYGANELLNYVSEKVNSNEGLAIMGTYTILFAGGYTLNKYVVPKITKKIFQIHNKNRKNKKRYNSLRSFLKTAVLSVGICAAVLSPEVKNMTKDYIGDWNRIKSAFERTNNAENNDPFCFQSKGLEDLFSDEFKKINIDLNDYNEESNIGRFYRTLRWDDDLEKIEIKYGLEPGILIGLTMQEGYGEPLRTNNKNDGGAGMFQFQPGTAKDYGLEVFENCNSTGRNESHGKALEELKKEYNYNYEILSKKDERFDVIKSANAAAKYLKDLYVKYGDWNKALSAYNAGKPVKECKISKHVLGVRKYQIYYLKQKKEMFGEKIHSGEKINNVLDRLNNEAEKFSYVGKNSKGMSVYRYWVKDGDNYAHISKTFNEWDKNYNKDKYKNMKKENIVNRNGKFIKDTLKSGIIIYLLSKPKK